VLPLSPGAERLGFEYYRRGTLSLYASDEGAARTRHAKELFTRSALLKLVSIPDLGHQYQVVRHDGLPDVTLSVFANERSAENAAEGTAKSTRSVVRPTSSGATGRQSGGAEAVQFGIKV